MTRWTARTPRPLPIAIRGASGPRTTPRLRVANEAMTIPGSSIGGTGPDALNPSAGLCPAVPGRYRIVSATSRPLSASSGIGHQAGWLSKPRSPGRVPNRYCCSSVKPSRKKYAAAATGTPMIAPNRSSTTYERLRRSSAGLGVARVDGAVRASAWPSGSTAQPFTARTHRRRQPAEYTRPARFGLSPPPSREDRRPSPGCNHPLGMTALRRRRHPRRAQVALGHDPVAHLVVDRRIGRSM